MKAKNHTLNHFVLYFIAFAGIALLMIYLAAVYHTAEYLLYFAPIFGILLYATYRLVVFFLASKVETGRFSGGAVNEGQPG